MEDGHIRNDEVTYLSWSSGMQNLQAECGCRKSCPGEVSNVHQCEIGSMRFTWLLVPLPVVE